MLSFTSAELFYTPTELEPASGQSHGRYSPPALGPIGISPLDSKTSKEYTILGTSVFNVLKRPLIPRRILRGIANTFKAEGIASSTDLAIFASCNTVNVGCHFEYIWNLGSVSPIPNPGYSVQSVFVGKHERIAQNLK